MQSRPARAARTVATLAGLGAAMAVLWWCRPRGASAAGPDAAVVHAATWAAWAVLGYLLAGTAAFVVASVRAADSAWAQTAAAGLPRGVRRAVDVALGAGVVLGTVAGPAGAVVPAGSDRPHPSGATIADLDWATAAGGNRVTVRPGDSLWTIAARSLEPTATDADVAAAWPRWWRTNRTLIGPDPDLLRPGQHLLPPRHSSGGTHGRHDG